MATPVVVQHETTTASSTSVGVDYPTGMTSGNLVLVLFGWVDGASPVTSTSGDLTPLGGVDDNENNRGNIQNYYREIDGTEGSSEAFTLGSDNDCTVHVIEISGWDTTEPPLAAYDTSGGTKSASPDPPSRAWGWSGDTLALCGFIVRGNETINSQPSGYTEVVNANNGGNAQHAVSKKAVTTSPENPSNYSLSSDLENSKYTIVIKGASAAAGVKVWTGSAFVEKPLKVWTGSAFETKPLKRWNGSAFV